MRKSVSKNSLFLMELIIVILVFSISAAACMQIFAAAKRFSLQSEAIAGANLRAQSAAEIFKAANGNLAETARLLGGEYDGAALSVYYDADWRVSGEGAEYTLLISRAQSGLGSGYSPAGMDAKDLAIVTVNYSDAPDDGAIAILEARVPGGAAW